MANTAIQTFGKYQILERIATGGMAEIYKARLEGIGGFQRTFAIKRILPNLSQNADYIAMLVDEAKVAGLLSHANIVQILDLGQVDGIWFIAMEYVEGIDLGALLRRASEKGQRLPVPHAVFVAMELLKGLEYAHGRQVMRGGKQVPLNIIHRDISPPNILLSYKGEVKLTDFGIARASLKVLETVSGIVKGRFDYMSSEQADGRKDLDQRSDLFSVGIVLYEMLTGEHPFRADNELATVERVRAGEYVPVATRNPEVPIALQVVVDRALQANRDRRFPSATAFKEALDSFFHDSQFIFSHQTLASYVQLLFPEGAPKKKLPEPVRPTRRRLGSSGDDEDESETPEGPTGMLERRAPPALTPQIAPGRHDAEATAIRQSPMAPISGSFGDEQETMIRRSPFEGEQETVIRRSPFLDEADVVSTGRPSMPDPHSGRSHSGDTARRLRTQTAPEQFAHGPRSNGPAIGWLGWLLSLMLLGVGVLVGASVGGGLVWVIATGAAALQPASLRVLAPPNTAVMLDGDAVGADVQVSPGEQHHVEIRIQGYRPWRQELVLAPGEQRVLVVTPVEVTKP